MTGPLSLTKNQLSSLSRSRSRDAICQIVSDQRSRTSRMNGIRLVRATSNATAALKTGGDEAKITEGRGRDIRAKADDTAKQR